MRGIKSMLHEKMDRHQEVADTFTGIRDNTKSSLEQQVAQKAMHLKVSAE